MKMNECLSLRSRVARCNKEEEFPAVQPGLAITPAQIMELAERGIAVNSQNAAMFSDGEINPSWVLPAEQSRGVDPADLWELAGDIKKKALAAYRADVAKYGAQSD